jgi:ABC-type glycerol-3-phosphate transport system substrate-binding protein
MKTSLKIVVLLTIFTVLITACTAQVPTAAPAEPEKTVESNVPAATDAPAPAPTEKITLSMEASSYVEAAHKMVYDQLEAMYEAANPNVDIVYNGYPYADYWDKLTTEIVTGNESCIVEMQSGAQHYGTYAALREGETGAFVNLDSYIEAAGLAGKLVDQDSMVYNGHYIGLSDYAWGARAVYYRKSLFQAAGIDPATIKTQNDFLDAAIKLTKPAEGDKPAQYGFGAVLSTHSFVWDEMKTFIARPIGAMYTTNNAPPYTADNVKVDSPEMKWAFKWWQDMIKVHQVTPPGSFDKAQERELFWNGTVAMNIDGPWFVGMTREKDPALMEDLGVFPSPQIEYNGQLYPFHGETYAVTHLISSKCPYPDEAWKFMEFLTSMEAQQVITGSGMIPTNLDFSLSDEYKASEPLNAQLAAFVDALYFFPAAVDPNIPQLGEMERIMIDAAQEAFITGGDVDAILDQAGIDVRAAIEAK